MLTRARLWLRSVLLRGRLEREMQEEMAGHLERATARLVARGLAPDDARREALREFGPVPFLQERAREARGGRWVDELAADVRFGRRHLARAPLTTLLMFVVLTVGIGLSVLLFSTVHSVAAAPDVHTLAELQAEDERDRRVATSWISAAGVLALLLSAIGLYAVVAFAVGRRTREIAVRMSVGAPGGRIVRRFVIDGLRLAVTGLALGLPVSLLGLAALPALDSDFPALPAAPVAAITAIGVIATAIMAAWIPARRAAAVDPAVVLRAE